MPNNACSPENVVGKMAGIFEAGGIRLEENALNVLDDNAKALYHQVRSQSGSQALQAARPDVAQTADDLINALTETTSPEGKRLNLEQVKGGVMDIMKPADFLPEEVTGPVFDFLDRFFVQNHNNLAQARGAYTAGIRQVLQEITPQVERLGEATKGQAAHWMRDLREGYPFYGKSGTIYDKARGNVVSNALDFSGTVLLGNPLEFIVKAPALYGIRPTFQGLAQLTAETGGNLWATLPELKAAGVYGLPQPSAPRSIVGSLNEAYRFINEAIMGLTDRPLKNLAYFTGKASGGSGLEAVERIAFKNRWGNDARLGRSNRDAVTLMNYTLNTYHMLGGMGGGMFAPGRSLAQRAEAARQFGMWWGLTSLIGGPAAAIPAPIAELLKKADPGYQEWEAANINYAGKLLRPGGVSFGIGAEMINRAGEAWGRANKKGLQKLNEGDVTGSMLDFADGGLSVMTLLTRSPLGNLRIQKALRTTRDLFEGDIDFNEYQQKLAETALPVLKQAP